MKNKIHIIGGLLAIFSLILTKGNLLVSLFILFIFFSIDLIYNYYFVNRGIKFISIENSNKVLLDIIKLKYKHVENISLNEGLDIIFKFFNEYSFTELKNIKYSFDKISKIEDSDMILLEWNKKNNNSLVISLIRQLIIEDESGEQVIKQLNLRYTFNINLNIENGNKWFQRLNNRNEIRDFIIGSTRLKDFLDEKPKSVEVILDTM